MKYAVDALDGKMSKTAKWVHDEVAPYATNNVQIPGANVRTVPVVVGVNIYPTMPGTLTLPVSPT